MKYLKNEPLDLYIMSLLAAIGFKQILQGFFFFFFCFFLKRNGSTFTREGIPDKRTHMGKRTMSKYVECVEFLSQMKSGAVLVEVTREEDHTDR